MVSKETRASKTVIALKSWRARFYNRIRELDYNLHFLPTLQLFDPETEHGTPIYIILSLPLPHLNCISLTSSFFMLIFKIYLTYFFSFSRNKPTIRSKLAFYIGLTVAGKWWLGGPLAGWNNSGGPNEEDHGAFFNFDLPQSIFASILC